MAGRLGYIGPFILLWALAHLLFAAIHHPEVFLGLQVDADGYMRLLRARDLMETGVWFDPRVERSNWPFGEVHHWTRPLDLILVLLTVLLRGVVGPAKAMETAGTLVAPLLHLGVCLIAVWAVGSLSPGRVRWLALPAVLLQPGLLAYGALGRADHHVLIFLLFLAATGAWIRTLLRPERSGPALGTGVLAGLGIWVSPEFLLPLALILAGGAAAWVLDGGRDLAGAGVRLCAALLGTLVLAVAIERAPSGWAQVDYDRISVAHATVALLGLAFWWVMHWIEARRGHVSGLRTGHVETPGPRIPWRLTAVLVGGMLAAVTMGVLHPGFFHGPWVDVEPEVIAVWLQGVSELQSIVPRALSDVGPFVQHLGAGFLALGATAAFLRSDSELEDRRGWLLLLLSLLVYLPLAAVQVRFSGYVGAVSVLALIELVRRGLGGIGSAGPSRGSPLLRVGIMVGILAGPAAVGAGFSFAFAGENARGGGSAGDATAGPRPTCALTPMTWVLADSAGLGAQPSTIAAFIDFGPELLYRTPHRVLAGPYHRNAQGILGAYRLLTATDDGEALALAREREVDLILLCPQADRAYFGRGGEEGLYSRLLEGHGPEWIRPVALPPEAPEGFLLLEVREAGDGA